MTPFLLANHGTLALESVVGELIIGITRKETRIIAMNKNNGIAAMSAGLFLTVAVALAIGASAILLADDEGHGGGKDRVLYVWRRIRLTSRRTFWR